jgi:hypothetical protein
MMSTSRLLPISASKQQIEEYFERCAIKEFCGNQSRTESEQQAFEEIFGKGEQERMKF